MCPIPGQLAERTEAAAPDALSSLLELTVRRAGPARVVLRQLPYQRWELILFVESRDILLTYTGDKVQDALHDASLDPRADLRGLPL